MHIRKCLEDICMCADFEIIIVDNNSTDKTKEIINKEFENIILVSNSENIGFGGGNNLGLKMALSKNADYVLLLNQDTYITIENVNFLVAKMYLNKSYGIISPMHFISNGKIQSSFEYHIKRNQELIGHFYSDSIKNKLYEVTFINAAIWLISKECLMEVGGFNPSFFHYGEDDNYCDRVLYHGFKIGVYPLAMAYHYNVNNYLDFFNTNLSSILLVKFIVKYSNPIFNKSYYLELVWIIVKLFYYFFMDKNLFKINFEYFKSLKLLDLGKINENRIISKTKKLAFLSIF